MIQIGHDQKLPVMSKFLSEIARVEQRAAISVRDYLGFGNHTQVGLKYLKVNGDDFIGEFNSDNKLHGRGIRIYRDGYIGIQYWNNGSLAPGNYIYIHGDGAFRVGEYYLKAG
jgi:hypothetical protein